MAGSGGPDRINSGRHHADDCVIRAIESDAAFDDVPVAAITTLPERMAQNDDLSFSDFVIVWHKGTTQNRIDSNDCEVAGAHSRADELLGFTVAGERQ